MGRHLKCHGLQVLVNLSSSLEMSDSISDLSYSRKTVFTSHLYYICTYTSHIHTSHIHTYTHHTYTHTHIHTSHIHTSHIHTSHIHTSHITHTHITHHTSHIHYLCDMCCAAWESKSLFIQ